MKTITINVTQGIIDAAFGRATRNTSIDIPMAIFQSILGATDPHVDPWTLIRLDRRARQHSPTASITPASVRDAGHLHQRRRREGRAVQLRATRRRDRSPPGSCQEAGDERSRFSGDGRSTPKRLNAARCRSGPIPMTDPATIRVDFMARHSYRWQGTPGRWTPSKPTSGQLRVIFLTAGLICLARDVEGDEPQIVECWL